MKKLLMLFVVMVAGFSWGAQFGDLTRTDVLVVATNEPFINARDYGAIGNGVADDTAALQAALNYVGSNDVAALYIPSGTYIITSPLVYHPITRGSKIFGDGEYRTIIKQTTWHTTGLNILSDASPGKDVITIRNIEFDGPATENVVATFTNTAGYGLVLNDTTATNIDRANLKHVRVTGFHTGLGLLNVAQSHVDTSWFGYNTVGMESAGNNNSLSFEASGFNGNLKGVHLEGGNSQTFTACEIGGSFCTNAVTMDSSADRGQATFIGCFHEWEDDSGDTNNVFNVVGQNNELVIINPHINLDNHPATIVRMSTSSATRGPRALIVTPDITNIHAASRLGRASHGPINQFPSFDFSYIGRYSEEYSAASIRNIEITYYADTTPRIVNYAPSEIPWRADGVEAGGGKTNTGTRGRPFWAHDGKSDGSSTKRDRLRVNYKKADGTYVRGELINENGFFDTWPTTQPSNIADSAGDDATAVNAILDLLEAWGLMAP